MDPDSGDSPSTVATSLETLTLEDSPTSDPLSPSTHFTTPADLCHSLPSLLSLARRGQWRLLVSSISTARSQTLPSLPPHHHLAYLSLSVLALFKLRRFSDAALELSSLDSLDSPQYLFSSFPHLYPNRSGSMLPFALRYLHAELPQRLGDRPKTLDRLYSLLDLVRSKSNTSKEWRRREIFLIASIACNHFAHKEFDVSLALINNLLSYDLSDPILLSKLGYIQLQIGDLDGARASFDRVEELGKREEGLENLIGRNKALGFIVAKDFVAAVREYEECIERNAGDVVAVNNKALCLMYLRDLSDSIKLLEGALERVPTAAVNETVIVNLCSMYELAYVNHGEIKKSLSSWIAKVAPDDFDSSCTRA